MWLTLHFHERCQWWKSVVNAVGSTARVLKRSWQLQLWIANSWDPWLQIQRFRPLVSAGQTHVILRAKLMTHGANMKIYCEENLPNFLSSNLGELAYNSTGCMCIYIYIEPYIPSHWGLMLANKMNISREELYSCMFIFEEVIQVPIVHCVYVYICISFCLDNLAFFFCNAWSESKAFLGHLQEMHDHSVGVFFFWLSVATEKVAMPRNLWWCGNRMWPISVLPGPEYTVL